MVLSRSKFDFSYFGPKQIDDYVFHNIAIFNFIEVGHEAFYVQYDSGMDFYEDGKPMNTLGVNESYSDPLIVFAHEIEREDPKNFEEWFQEQLQRIIKCYPFIQSEKDLLDFSDFVKENYIKAEKMREDFAKEGYIEAEKVRETVIREL